MDCRYEDGALVQLKETLSMSTLVARARAWSPRRRRFFEYKERMQWPLVVSLELGGKSQVDNGINRIMYHCLWVFFVMGDDDVVVVK